MHCAGHLSMRGSVLNTMPWHYIYHIMMSCYLFALLINSGGNRRECVKLISID